MHHDYYNNLNMREFYSVLENKKGLQMVFYTIDGKKITLRFREHQNISVIKYIPHDSDLLDLAYSGKIFYHPIFNTTRNILAVVKATKKNGKVNYYSVIPPKTLQSIKNVNNKRKKRVYKNDYYPEVDTFYATSFMKLSFAEGEFFRYLQTRR